MIGGGNSAVEEAVFLARFASKVTVVARGPALTASRVAQEKALAHQRRIMRLPSRVRAARRSAVAPSGEGAVP